MFVTFIIFAYPGKVCIRLCQALLIRRYVRCRRRRHRNIRLKEHEEKQINANSKTLVIVRHTHTHKHDNQQYMLSSLFIRRTHSKHHCLH
jgi:ribosomal protein L40E